VLIYILIYGAMNLGAFACVIAISRRTRSAEIESYRGLGRTAPFLAVTFSMFLFSLAGIPPLGGWFAKFVMFRAVFDAGTTSAVVLGVIAAVNSVIALFYYAGVGRVMWFREPVEATADTPATPSSHLPVALGAAIVLTVGITLVIGVYPQFFARVGELAFQTG
jgi:NADH-quinone oxidoreductase subunit N